VICECTEIEEELLLVVSKDLSWYDDLVREILLLQEIIMASVVADNEYDTWESYNQRYGPVIYLIDKKGIIR